MFTFDDIEFKPHSVGYGLHGVILFPGGYGLSVSRLINPVTQCFWTYCDDNTWEVAIIKGNKDNWDICYDTKITDNVLTYQTEEDINRIIKHIIRLY